jgi:hypothetical protein
MLEINVGWHALIKLAAMEAALTGAIQMYLVLDLYLLFQCKQLEIPLFVTQLLELPRLLVLLSFPVQVTAMLMEVSEADTNISLSMIFKVD